MIHKNMDNLHNPWTKLKIPDRKGYIPFYHSYSGKGYSIKAGNRLLEAGGGGERLNCKGHEGTLWGDKNVLYPETGCGYTAVYILQNSWNCTIKMVNILYIDHT